LWRSGITVGVAALAAALLFAGTAQAQDAKKETEADLQFEFAEKLFQIKVYKTAAAEYRRFLREYPKDPRREEARYKLALCHAKLGGGADGQKALAELVTLRKEFPNGKRLQDGLFRSGHLRYFLGDSKGAIADLGELAKLEVRADLQVPMHHFLGRAHYDLGQSAQALKHLTIVARAPKKTELRPFALIVLADLHLKMKDLTGNAAVLESLLRDYPRLVTADEMRVKLGDSRLALKQFAKALDAYESVAAKGRYKDIAAIGRARSLLGLKKYADAIAVCDAVMAGFRETPETKNLELPEQCVYITGLARFQEEKYAAAVAAFTKLLEKVRQGPMAEDGSYKLCWSYYRQGPKFAKKLIAACVVFRRSFPASKWAGQIVFLTAEGHLNLDDYANAAAQYKQIDPNNPTYADALYRIAYCYHRQNKLADAAHAYDLFVKKFGQHRRAAAALASSAGLYQAAGRFKEAAERYAQYLALAPQGPDVEEALYQRGICFAKMSQFGDMAVAFAAYTKRYAEGKHAAVAFWWLGRHHRIRADALAGKGAGAITTKEYEAAVEAFRASAALGGPNKNKALLALAECSYNLGKNQAERAAGLRAKLKTAGDEQKQKLANEAAGLEKQAAASFRSAARGFLGVMTTKPGLMKVESVYLWAGTYFREHGDPKAAIQTFTIYIGKFKKSEKADVALYQLARLHGELDPPDHKAVIKYCDQLLEHHGKSKLALQTKSVKAEALYRLQKYDAAEKLYIEVSQRGAGALKVDAIITLGHVCFAKKEYAAAARYFAEIGLLYDDPEFAPDALYFAGKANFLLKDHGEAVKFWQQLLARYPASKRAANARKELGPLGHVIAPDGSIKKK